MLQRDIAKKLGISTATVSLVLRGMGRASAETRERIIELARTETIRFRRPNRRIEAQTSGETRRIMYCGYQERFGWFSIGTSCRLNEMTFKGSYDLSLVVPEPKSSEDIAQVAERIAQEVAESKPHGLILSPDPTIAKALDPLGIPTVHLGYFAHRDGEDTVSPDNFQGAVTLTQAMLRRGRTRIAVVRVLTDQMNSRERFAAIQMTIAEAGLHLDPRMVVSGTCRYQEGARCAAALCASCPEPPDGIIMENDWILPEFIQYLRQHRPAHWPTLPKIHFAIHCDSERPHTLTSSFDSAYIPRLAMGRQAIMRMIDRLADPVAWRPMAIRLTPKYVPGDFSDQA